MSLRSELMARLTKTGGVEPLFVADLSGWYRRNVRRDALPRAMRNQPLADIYRSLGLPVWDVVRAWNEQVPGLRTEESEASGVRTRTVQTVSGPLTWRWELDDEGAWQQTGYPVSGPADMPAAVEWARALQYALDTEGLTERQAAIGDDGLLVLELPARPLVQIMRDLIGYERAMDMLDEPGTPLILAHLEAHLQDLVTALAQLAATVQFSPDDLDENTLHADLFREHLLPSYRVSMHDLGDYRKRLLVRTRGPVAGLVDLLLRSGITGLTDVPALEGTQSLGDLSGRLGEQISLWGGIPGEVLRRGVPRAQFTQAVRQAAEDAAGHRGILLGVAGGVPADADLKRLQAVPDLISQAA